MQLAIIIVFKFSSQIFCTLTFCPVGLSRFFQVLTKEEFLQHIEQPKVSQCQAQMVHFDNEGSVVVKFHLSLNEVF